MFWLPAASQTLLHNANSKRKGLGLQKLVRQQTSKHYAGKQWERGEQVSMLACGESGETWPRHPL